MSAATQFPDPHDPRVETTRLIAGRLHEVLQAWSCRALSVEPDSEMYLYAAVGVVATWRDGVRPLPNERDSVRQALEMCLLDHQAQVSRMQEAITWLDRLQKKQK